MAPLECRGIAQASDDLSRRTERQAAGLEETAAALEELTASVKMAAQGARKAADVVAGAKDEAQRSGGVVQETVAAMGDIYNADRLGLPHAGSDPAAGTGNDRNLACEDSFRHGSQA